MMTYFKFE